jgi:hypothetical protein
VSSFTWSAGTPFSTGTTSSCARGCRSQSAAAAAASIVTCGHERRTREARWMLPQRRCPRMHCVRVCGAYAADGTAGRAGLRPGARSGSAASGSPAPFLIRAATLRALPRLAELSASSLPASRRTFSTSSGALTARVSTARVSAVTSNSISPRAAN